GAGAGGSTAAGGSAVQAPGLSSGTARDAGCVNGRQVGPTFYMPACSATYTPDPQATMTGVSPTKINFIYYLGQGNAQVNAILNEENLAANPQQECVAIKAFTAELNKRWEFYGRKLVSLDGPGNHSGLAEGGCNFPFFQGQCNLTPPDIPCFQAEADLVASLHPAFVIAPTAYPAFEIRLAQDHIVVAGGSAGGENIPESYYNQLAPYYYNVFPSGTQTVTQLAEFYCKKLSGKPVQYAGRGPSDVIPLTGSPPIRKVGIIYPENNGDPTQKISADLFAHLVSGGECGSPNDGTQEFAYASNINTAQQQADTIVAGIKNAHITTVVCLCDPIAPVFFTNTLDQQQYHPEFLIPGSGLLDYDVLAQLYNANEMKYAFGPSELADAIPFAQSDAVKAWQDAGNSGEPDQTQNLNWAYFNLMGNAIQAAGPDLTPGNIRQGLSAQPSQGGTPTEAALAYNGSYPWTGIKDFRQVYYCPTKISPINGKPGAYVALNGGQRKQLGQLSSSTSGFFPGGPCA
ncbi:MAG: type 1 periplasmic-binding domain-containing protein, partial [Acidimicrobiales bacterium]